MEYLDAKIADRFEPFTRPYRDGAWKNYVLAGSMVMNVLLVAGLVRLALRPTDTIVKDRIFGDAPVLLSAVQNPPITAQDARIFLRNMIRLRYGWDSRTVYENVTEYLGQCHGVHKQIEDKYVFETLTDREGTHGNRERWAIWQAEDVKHHIIFPDRPEAIACAPLTGAWSCEVTVEVIKESLAAPFAKTTPVPVRFEAVLAQVPHSRATPSGLLVAKLHPSERKS